MTVTNRLSKAMSYALRHHPEEFGLAPDGGGWVEIDDLVAGLGRRFPGLTREDVLAVVDACQKKRFGVDNRKIRAVQGHSIPVDLGYEAASPPVVLYHGTAAANIPSIREQGLRKMARHDVHLSDDHPRARVVGGRRGSPVVLVVRARDMERDGFTFRVTPNGVWLTPFVPPEYID